MKWVSRLLNPGAYDQGFKEGYKEGQDWGHEHGACEHTHPLEQRWPLLAQAAKRGSGLGPYGG
ncbi:hypothetical protein LCGC14_3071070, partial [marine sediment metagenome]